MGKLIITLPINHTGFIAEICQSCAYHLIFSFPGFKIQGFAKDFSLKVSQLEVIARETSTSLAG